MDEAVITWRGEFANPEVNRLHAAAFNVRSETVMSDEWWPQVNRWSLGWCTARLGRELVGFANVPWDGGTHAWLQDVIVAPDRQRLGIGRRMVDLAAAEASAAGCEWLHVDFADDVDDFYLRTCGFEPTQAGLRYLR